MNRHPPLSQDEILSLFVVDAENGKLFWRRLNKYHPRLTGTEAGFAADNRSNSKKKYWIVKIGRTQYRRGQIILASATGRWPDEQVDHINGDSLDDRAVNLRHATQQQNSWNHKTRAKSDAAPMGVRSMPNGKFQARIRRDHATKHLGVFDSAHEAEAAYKAARKELFGDFQ